MKLCFTVLACFAMSATLAFGQVNYDMTSLTSIGKASGEPAEGPAALCDTLDALAVGPMNGQIGDSGMTYGTVAEVNVVDVGGGDLEANSVNALGNDTFTLQIFVDVEPAGISPMADDGMTIGFDYSLTDLNTNRFYAPQGADQALIFTRLGDPDGNGTWDVLETDGLGGGVFFDTGVAIALSGRVEFIIADEDMDITVDGTTIYSGGIIGSNGDIGPPPERLTSIVTQSTNNAIGLGSEENIDNISINTTPCGDGGGCPFALGDINEDGVVDLLDVTPFVMILTGGGTACQADINGDGVIDLLDVTPFVNILTGG